MDYDNDKAPSSAISKTDTSVVRRRSRGAETSRHRHTSPTIHTQHEHSGDDLPVPSSRRREKDEQPENLAGSRISHAFRGFTVAPDVIPDEKVGYLLPCQPPNVMRSISDESTSSSQTAGSATLVIDTGHYGLVSSIGTTEKFTHKWPTPKSLSYEPQLRNLKGATGLRPTHSPVSVLEDGQGLGTSHVARWTAFKWCLLLSVATVFAYGTAGLIFALMTWFRTWDKASVMAVADGDLLILITCATSVLLFTALLGMTGAFLNSRPILAVYAVLLWPAFISLLSVGYVAYKRDVFSLDHKLNLSWSRNYNALGRLIIQDSLQCCGFYSTLHAASPSKQCYLRAPLPGCKGNLYNFEHQNLSRIWTAAFALVPLHMVNLVVALLCVNHMTNTFGKGITPKQYRLNATDVKADADKIMDGVGSVFRPHPSKALPSNFSKDEKEGLIHAI